MRLTQEAINKNAKLMIWLYFCTKISVVLGGLLPVWLGYRLFVLGVTGKASLIIETKNLGGQLVNAAPGLFFALFGAIILWRAVSRIIDIRIVRNGDSEPI